MVFSDGDEMRSLSCFVSSMFMSLPSFAFSDSETDSMKQQKLIMAY